MLKRLLLAVTYASLASPFLPRCACWGLRAEWIPVVVNPSSSSPSSSASHQVPVRTTPDTTTTTTSTPQPRRSGHVAFWWDGHSYKAGTNDEGPFAYVFGGYAEVDHDGDDSNKAVGKERFVANDLWRWRRSTQPDANEDRVGHAPKGGWVPVHLNPAEAAGASSDSESSSRPRARLVAAAAVLDDYAYVIGGWDPGVPGTGGEILSSVHRLGPLSSNNDETEDRVETRSVEEVNPKPLSWTRLPDFPDGPTSRHVAVTVVCGGIRKIVVHNHRCRDHVWVLDPNVASSNDPNLCVFVKQPTVGEAPSPRGLHAATVLGDDRIVVFGGAAQDGTMSNEVFVLDANTWTWTRPTNSDELEMPCPRAAPCLVAFDDTTAILFGGAEATPQGLKPLGDVWSFDTSSGAWQRLLEGPKGPPYLVGGDAPPPRNAATLTCISSTDEYIDRGYRDYLLAGGWHPFVQTWDDCYVLRIHRNP